MKKSYFTEKLNAHKSDLRKTWKLLREATSKLNDKSSIIECLKINDVPCSDAKQMAEEFNRHFTGMADLIAEKIAPTDRPPDLNHKVFNCNFISSSIPVSTDELIKTVRSLKPKTSTDMNGISTALIKKCVHSIAGPLRHIINLSLGSGLVPRQFKIAKIIPIYKSGDKDSADNYRPISMLCSFSKIIEKIMGNRLTEYLEDNCILSDFQFGFRKKHSTEHPLVLFLNKISEAVNNKESTITIFCDLQKAFDTCDHNILLKKMSNVGIRGMELEWFRNYLLNRQQFVSVGGGVVFKEKCEKRRAAGLSLGSSLIPYLYK
jgi:hypothetical protein